MDFTVKADPKPSITWYHEGKEVKETSKIKMSMTQTKDVYYIKLELTVSIKINNDCRIHFFMINFYIFLPPFRILAQKIQVYINVSSRIH